MLAGLRRDDLHTVVIEQFMTDTARYADVVLPATTQLEHLDAVFSWGHHYFTLNEPAIAPPGEAKTTTEAFRLLAAALGFDDPAFRESDEELLERLLDGRSGGSRRSRRCASAAGRRSTPGTGRFRTPRATSGRRRESSALRADWLVDAGVDPVPFFDPPAEATDEALAAQLPAGAGDAEDAPVPELHVREPEPPARRPSPSRTWS